MKTKKISSKSADKTSKKKSKPILRKINNVDRLFTKKDIKNIVDDVVNRTQI